MSKCMSSKRRSGIIAGNPLPFESIGMQGVSIELNEKAFHFDRKFRQSQEADSGK